MSKFQLPHQPKYSQRSEYDLEGIESIQIPDVSGVVRDLIINEEELAGTLNTLLEDLNSAQGIFRSYGANHSEEDSRQLQERFDEQCGSYSSCYYALGDIEARAKLVVSAIQELNEYPGMAEELWEAVKGKEFAPLTGAFLSNMSEAASGSDGAMSNAALGAVTHVDQMVELVKKVNTWIDYTSRGISKIGEGVQWLQAEVSRQEDEDKVETRPEV